ncbi:hypothetical protein [Geodermatophilus poikilotrophus]|uniref:Uncharacterized protein n=1 Tax=Geodermatophilus poikilotrophus TaxID=1333667 RepID=A0A1I0CT60_9ACTN|nr:hypothetical protein [Geodermatophilus poikilotrophus]SET22977.1 hypothetical protein SAMN04488546_1755 [Geodermatophilus poikilotrophus]
MTDRELEPTAASSSRTVPCTSHAAGHAVHPTRVLLCDTSPDDAWTPVVVMGAVGDVLTVACGAELRRYRNHGTGGLLDLVDATGPDALLNERYGLLFLRSWPQDAAAVFSLQPADQPPHPCRHG